MGFRLEAIGDELLGMQRPVAYRKVSEPAFRNVHLTSTIARHAHPQIETGDDPRVVRRGMSPPEPIQVELRMDTKKHESKPTENCMSPP